VCSSSANALFRAIRKGRCVHGVTMHCYGLFERVYLNYMLFQIGPGKIGR
jgi:hypothetical protein